MLSRLQRKVGLAVSGVAETKEGEEVERAAGGSGTLSVTMEIYHNFCLTSLFISLKMFLYRLNPPTIHFSAQIIGEIIHVIKECKSSLEKSEPFWLLSNVSFLFVFFFWHCFMYIFSIVWHWFRSTQSSSDNASCVVSISSWISPRSIFWNPSQPPPYLFLPHPQSLS